MRAVPVSSPPQRVFLNVGTHASIPFTPGLRECEPLTNIEALELDRLPDHLIVIGGGYVGLEFAQAYRRFGSRVTVLQRASHFLDKQDLDVSEALQEILFAEGIEVTTSAEVMSVKGRSRIDVSLVVRTPEGDRTIVASDVLVTTGRSPNTAGLGLEATGVEVVSGVRQMSGRLASVPAAHNSLMPRSITFGLFATILQAAAAEQVDD